MTLPEQPCPPHLSRGRFPAAAPSIVTARAAPLTRDPPGHRLADGESCPAAGPPVQARCGERPEHPLRAAPEAPLGVQAVLLPADGADLTCRRGRDTGQGRQIVSLGLSSCSRT